MVSTPSRSIQERKSLDPQLLRVLADPIRSFVVYSVIPEAKTVKQLAHELGCPVTRLYYHIKQLEKHDLIFVESSRVVSGIEERHYRAAARELCLDRAAFGPDTNRDRSRSEALLAFVFDQSRLEIARGLEQGQIDVTRPATEAGALLAYRNVLKLSPEQAEGLYRRLYDFWMEYEAVAKQPAENGSFYAFAVTLYPNAPLATDTPSKPSRSKSRRSRQP